MAAEEKPHSRPSSGALRRSQNKLSMPAVANEKLVWFAPVSSPLLSSPARDPITQSYGQIGPKKKTKKMAGATPRQLSMFSNFIQQQQDMMRVKGAIEAEEPTSPKVSCMGQVKPSYSRSKSKDQCSTKLYSSSSSAVAAVESTYTCRSVGSRFFGSPAPAPALAPASPTLSSDSALSSTKQGGFSKWSSLLFRSSGKESCKESVSHELDIAIKNQDHKQGSIWRMAFPKNLKHVGVKGSASSHQNDDNDNGSYWRNERSHLERIQQAQDDALFNGHVKATPDGQQYSINRNGSVEHIKSTYDQLPSLLRSGSGIKEENLKVSLDVVPETWLWRDGQMLMADDRHINDMKSKASNKGEVLIWPSAKIDDAASSIKTSSLSHVISVTKTPPLEGRSFNETEEAGNAAPLQSGCIDETNGRRGIPSQCTLEQEGSQLDVAPLCCGTNSSRIINDVYADMERTRNNHAENQRFSVAVLSDLKESQLKAKTMGSTMDDNMDERNNLYSADLIYDTLKHSGGNCKAHISRASSSGTLILVGYNLNEDMRLDDCKKVLKGAFEVGRLSLDGTGRLLQLLKEGETEFIRSRSATSHSRGAIVCLQRSNSEPSKKNKKNGH